MNYWSGILTAIFTAAGIVVVLVPGILWLRLQLRIRAKLSAMEKNLAEKTPKPASPNRDPL